MVLNTHQFVKIMKTQANISNLESLQKMVEKLDADRTMLLEALQKIKKLDPEFDSDEGFNEWGQAHCFIQCQEIAGKAIAKATE